MKNRSHEQAIGIPIKSVSYPADGASATEASRLYLQSRPSKYKQRRLGSMIGWMNRFSKQADSLAKSILEHVSLGPKILETVKGKLTLGAKILQAGGVERVFRQKFDVEKGEKLLKAFQCYLSTTSGPISGMLFISTKKIAFHSDRSLKLSPPSGAPKRAPYKVLIPIERVKGANASENSANPNQKYVQLVTIDEFEFWFMGFLGFQRLFKHLRKAVSESKVGFL